MAQLTQATYLGGSSGDSAYNRAFNATTLTVYVGGTTNSSNFPATARGAQPTFGGPPPPTFTGDGFVARLTSGLAATDPIGSLSASVNQPTFAIGQTLTATLGFNNQGLQGTADFYLGILRPDQTIQFFRSTGFVVASLADPASFKPVATGVPLATPFSGTAPNFYTDQWTGSEAYGGYLLFFVAITPNGIIGLGTASYSYP
jgi:hypothetical protein